MGAVIVNNHKRIGIFDDYQVVSLRNWMLHFVIRNNSGQTFWKSIFKTASIFLVGVGYNGMPHGCNDDDLPWGKSSEAHPLDTKVVIQKIA